MDSLEKKLSYSFKDKNLLKSALTHISYLKSYKTNNFSHYEILEFLGDALVNLFIVDILVESFPNKREGDLSPVKSFLVSEEFLSSLAKYLELDKHILISKGEEIKGSRQNNSILCDVFEAIWAAIYIDSGRDLNLLKELFNKAFKDEILKIIKENRVKQDYKTILQEITQKKYRERPIYSLQKVEGPQHDKQFYVECSFKEAKSYGKGKSKKEAEQQAAKEMLKNLGFFPIN